jgi:hypothetical protein
MREDETRLDCPQCGGWVPVREGTITATCPYCWQLIPLRDPREKEALGLGGLLRRLHDALEPALGAPRRRFVVVRAHLAGGFDRRGSGLVFEPDMAVYRNPVLVAEAEGRS